MRPDCCINFNGIQHETCEAGVNYLKIARPISDDDRRWKAKNYPHTPNDGRTRIAIRVPCWPKNNVHTCAAFRLPTADELADHERKTNEFVATFLKRLKVVRPAIVNDIEAHDATGENCAGSIPCPACETGRVAYTYAGAYNGHVSAKCSTADCVEWIE